MAKKEKDIITTTDKDGWGGIVKSDKGTVHMPPIKNDTCPNCGSKDISWETGFCILAEVFCNDCNFKRSFCW